MEDSYYNAKNDNLFINNLSYSLCTKESKEILKNLKIYYDIESSTFILRDKYFLSVSVLLNDIDCYVILLSFLACNIIKKRYPELDLQSLIILLLGDKAVNSSSLVRFCLVLMRSKVNGSKFIELLLVNMGFTKARVYAESNIIASKYIL